MITEGILKLDDLDCAYVAIVQHFTQQLGVIHQVTLRPDKVRDGLIRLGETAGDELTGWNYPESLTIVSILGTAHQKTPSGTGGIDWECRPLQAANSDGAEKLAKAAG